MQSKIVVRLSLTLLCTLILTAAWAQPASIDFGVAYYDVGQLYDTFQSQDYNDKHFTEQGSMRWDRQRYQRKIEHTVRVIDSMALPVMILYGVENKRVVRDLVALSKRDYAYIHRDQNINNGLEFAVLYEADKFFPEKVTCWDKALCIEGQAAKAEIVVIANARCTSIGALIEEIGIDAKSDNIILIGQPSKLNFEQFGLLDATLAAQRQGRGNYATGRGWIMRDRVATNITSQSACDVFIKSWLLDDFGKPISSVPPKAKGKAHSASLPIYIYFEDLFAY